MKSFFTKKKKKARQEIFDLFYQISYKFALHIDCNFKKKNTNPKQTTNINVFHFAQSSNESPYKYSKYPKKKNHV